MSTKRKLAHNSSARLAANGQHNVNDDAIILANYGRPKATRDGVSWMAKQDSRDLSEANGMLAPKLTLRQLFYGVGGMAFYLAIVSLAYRGNMVATGLAAAIFALTLVFLIYGVFYGITQILAPRRSRPGSAKKV